MNYNMGMKNEDARKLSPSARGKKKACNQTVEDRQIAERGGWDSRYHPANDARLG